MTGDVLYTVCPEVTVASFVHEVARGQMTERPLQRWLDALRQRVLRRIERDHPAYQRRIFNNMARLQAQIRPGDLVLVEGRSEMSRIIKLFSSSHWSHVAMYVGDRLAGVPAPSGQTYGRVFGPSVAHLVVEAFSGQGVIAAPLEKYSDFNIRICRPYGIRSQDLERVIGDVIAHIGRRYDDRNILDIARLILFSALKPRIPNARSFKACLGSCNAFQVICSGMIAKAFQKVGYPIVPALAGRRLPPATLHSNPYGAGLIMRHYSQILPRDFDLSPNFEVIKFNIIGQPFNYDSLWQDRDAH